MIPLVLFGVVLAASSAPSSSSAGMPCGYVEFRPHGPPRYRDGTTYETIVLTVHFPDGHPETATLPYPWVYPDGERTDPWSSTNLQRPDFQVPFQSPPPDFDRTKLSPLIAYVIQHTDARGYTDLPACPKGPPEAKAYVVMPSAAKLGARPYSHRSVSSSGVLQDDDDCVSFTNLATVAAVRIVFQLQYIEAGRPLDSRLRIEARGRFEPNVEIAPWRQIASDYCGTRPAAAADSARKGGLTVTRLDVLGVDYADGSSWRASGAALPITKER